MEATAAPIVRLTTFRIPAAGQELPGTKSSAAIIRFSRRCTNGSPLDYFRRDGKEASTWNEAPRAARNVQEWYTEHSAYGTVGYMLWSAALAVARMVEGGSEAAEARPWWKEEKDTEESFVFAKKLSPTLESDSYYDGETAREHFLTLAWRKIAAPSPRGSGSGKGRHVDREIVGYISCSYMEPRDAVVIDAIGTKGVSGLPEYKAMRIGTKLLRASFARAKREEPRVRWAMVAPHPNAIPFYAKVGGFRRVGCGDRAVLVMVRVLRRRGRGGPVGPPPIRRVIEAWHGGEGGYDDEIWTPETFRGGGAGCDDSMSWPEEDIAQFFRQRSRGKKKGAALQ